MEPSSCPASQETSQQEKCPILPQRKPACCLRGVGPVPSRSVPSGSSSAPLPPPCPKASCRREPYGPLWTHFPWVQYLPGVNVGPSAPESAAPPLPPLPLPTPAWGESSCCWGAASSQNRGALWSQGEKCLGSTHTHAHTENS